MSRRLSLIIILGLSLTMWGWVGYRVLAVQTGKLGAVSTHVTGLDQGNKYVQWSPRVESYTFSDHDLILAPKATALFLVNPPKRFSRGTVAVVASGAVNLTAEYPPGAAEPADVSMARTWRWSEITRFPGGHRLHIVNLTDEQLLVREIKLTFIP